MKVNQFIELMAEEILNEEFDIKSIASAFFKRYPQLLSQVKKLCNSGSKLQQLNITKNDYKIIQALYVKNNKKKAEQLIKKFYKPNDFKYKYWMNIDELSEAKGAKRFLLSLAMSLALAAGLLTGCTMPYNMATQNDPYEQNEGQFIDWSPTYADFSYSGRNIRIYNKSDNARPNYINKIDPESPRPLILARVKVVYFELTGGGTSSRTDGDGNTETTRIPRTLTFKETETDLLNIRPGEWLDLYNVLGDYKIVCMHFDFTSSSEEIRDIVMYDDRFEWIREENVEDNKITLPLANHPSTFERKLLSYNSKNPYSTYIGKEFNLNEQDVLLNLDK